MQRVDGLRGGRARINVGRYYQLMRMWIDTALMIPMSASKCMSAYYGPVTRQ